MNCCDFHRIDCDQGDDCPVRLAQQTDTPLITGNSDGSSAHATDDLIDDTGLLMLQGLAMVAFVVSVVALASLYVGA